MSFEELVRLQALLTEKIEALSRQQKPQNDELELSVSMLKFVQMLVQRELKGDEKLWMKPDDLPFSQSISVPPVIYKMVANATICTNCREKHPNMTHCVHVMSDCLSDAYMSQSDNAVSLRDSDLRSVDIDKFIIKG